MSESITSEFLAKEIRTIGAKFTISGNVISNDGSKFTGNGTLSRTKNNFLLSITFPEGGEPTQLESKVYNCSNCWSFEGTLGSSLNFTAKHLFPGGTTQVNNGVTSIEFETQTLSLEPSAADSLPIHAIEPILGAVQAASKENRGELPQNLNIQIAEQNEDKTSDNKEAPSPYAQGIWMHAHVPDYTLIDTNGGTKLIRNNDFLGSSSKASEDTYSGSIADTQFGIIEDGDDLDIYLFNPTLTDETIHQKTHTGYLTAFLYGLAFATGQHCWPDQIVLRQNGRLLLNELHAASKPDRSALTPFSERIGFNAKIGNVEWDFGKYLGQATLFFNTQSALAEAASQALWLLRSADSKKTPSEITLMALSVLLESLTNTIFKELKLESAQDEESFENARAKLLKWIDENELEEDSGLQRFQNIIKSISLNRAKDKYQAVSEHLKLPWDGLMKDAWDIWTKVRNRGVHDILQKEKKEKLGASFTATARIAGAINVIVLRLIGYSGIARTSVYEDKHHKI